MTEEAFGVVASVVRQRPDDLVGVHGHAELLVDSCMVDVRRCALGTLAKADSVTVWGIAMLGSVTAKAFKS